MEKLKLYEDFWKGRKKKNEEKSKKGLIDHILNLQGKEYDQRYDKTIYTPEELQEMNLEEIMSIYRRINHPQGRPW